MTEMSQHHESCVCNNAMPSTVSPPPVLHRSLSYGHSPPPRPSLAILAVEDDAASIAILRHILDRQGFPYTLQVIRHGREARAFFDRLAAQADLPCPDV